MPASPAGQAAGGADPTKVERLKPAAPTAWRAPAEVVSLWHAQDAAAKAQRAAELVAERRTAIAAGLLRSLQHTELGRRFFAPGNYSNVGGG